MVKQIVVVVCMVLLVFPFVAGACNVNISSSLQKKVLMEGEVFEEIVGGPEFVVYSVASLEARSVNMSLNQKTGKLLYVPSGEEVGSHAFVLVGVTKEGCVASSLVTFAVNGPPRIVKKLPEENPVIDEGSFTVFEVVVEDEGNVSYAWYLDGKKEGVQSTFTYRTDFFSRGAHNISVVVSDEYQATSTASWNVTVADINRPPLLVYEVNDFTMYEGTTQQPYDLDVFFMDPDGDNLSYSFAFVDNLVETSVDVFLAVRIDNESRVTMNAKGGFVGRKAIRFEASDGNLLKESNIAFVTIIPLKVECGDGICFQEDCTSCAKDCGECGGCFEKWICSEWSNCLFGEMQKRSCKEVNACGQERNRPEEQRSCPYSCFDRTKNQNEEGIDCGGVCPACPLCKDYQKNGNETDVDCGGLACPACLDGKKCRFGSDCQSKSCVNGVCANATCSDGVKNQAEEGIDCGAVCNVQCASCSDGKMNQGEVGVDCGLVCGRSCPSCRDGIKNQNEKEIDCGGVCSACASSAKVSLFAFILISVCVVSILAIIELRFGVVFRVLKLDKSVLSLIFFNRLWRLFHSVDGVYVGQTTDALAALDEIGERGLDQENLDVRVLEVLDNYFNGVFGLAETFREEQLQYKLQDGKIPVFVQHLILLLYRDVERFRQSKYRGPADAMQLVEKAIAVLKESRDAI